MLEWLRRRKQTPAAISRFWRIVLVSALSEELDRIDARYGVDVFWKAVLSNRDGYRMGVPQVALADLYDGCRLAIEQKGGEVTLRSPLRKIVIENGAVTAVGFDNDRQETADAYVFAAAARHDGRTAARTQRSNSILRSRTCKTSKTLRSPASTSGSTAKS